MVVQVTNKGGDLSKAHFDIQIPGAGFGIFNGCAAHGADSMCRVCGLTVRSFCAHLTYDPPHISQIPDLNGPPQFIEPYSVWGKRYGGVSSISDCDGLPASLRAGCKFRFSSLTFNDADNPG